jgi:hypothetical protein
MKFNAWTVAAVVALVWAPTGACAGGADGKVKDAPHRPDFTPFSIENIKRYFGDQLKESGYLCTLPINAAMRPPKGTDCRVWTTEKVMFSGYALMDSASYRATDSGLISSVVFTQKVDCTTGLENFMRIHASAPHSPPVKMVYIWGDSVGEMEVEFPRPNGASNSLSLEFKKGQCDLYLRLNYLP